jgi:ribosomal protein S18 acetylase RimI-like enzyme
MLDEDLAFAASVYVSTRLEELAVTNWPLDQQMAFLRQQHEAQHSHYRAHYQGAQWLIIESRGRDVGRLYRVEWPGELRIIDIALLPEARRGGIGSRIIAAIQAEARSLGKKVSIHVEKNNPARVLYHRLGFAVVEDKGVYDLLEWSAAAGPEA